MRRGMGEAGRSDQQVCGIETTRNTALMHTLQHPHALPALTKTRTHKTAQVEGASNLPPVDQPAVYVANHLSFMDIFTLFHLARPFKFISKTSIFFIPIVGWSMFLTGGWG